MAALKIFGIFVVLCLIQNCFAKPVEDTSESLDSAEEREVRKNPTPGQKLVLFAYDNFLSLGQQFANDAANVSRSILKDPAMIDNSQSEVLLFKKNLTLFVNKVEANTKPLKLWDILDIYTITTDRYSEMSEDKVTPEAKLIIEMLDKYNSDAAAVKFGLQFIVFMDNFVKLFEEEKAHLDKNMLDWYENYQSITDIEKKIDAFSGFMDLIDDV